MLEVVEAERAAGPVAGVICTLGGQTPLALAQRLKDAGVPVLGTAPEAIDAAEDRGEFSRVLADTGLPAPKHGTAVRFAEAREIAAEIGYPVLVRPSYVLGGRGMEIVYEDATLEAYLAKATDVSPTTRCSSTGSWRTPSRSTSTPSTTAPSSTWAGSWSTSRRPASTPATRRARCRRSRWAAPT